jgi:aryl-alcohol dehydrogenase-like predicted oxidoreductase
MTFGMKDWGCDQAAAADITHAFLDAGGNFIDTADMYSSGVSEEMTAAAIRGKRRDELVLATKAWFRMGPTPNAKGLSRKHLVEALHDSLRRLQTDYVDLYQVHGPDPFTPIDETMRTLESFIQSGKVRYIGCSNYYGWQIVKSNAVADQHGWSRFVSGQHMYNLLRRDIEREILPACASEGLGMLCWSPLAGGMLTGKYTDQSGPPPDSRVGVRANIDLPRYWNAQSFAVIDELKAIAAQLDKTPSQVALSWLLQDRRVTAAIVGARAAEQLKDNLECGDWDLPAEFRDRLSEVVPFQHGYPREWIDTTWQNIAGQEEFAPWEVEVRP